MVTITSSIKLHASLRFLFNSIWSFDIMTCSLEHLELCFCTAFKVFLCVLLSYLIGR